MATPTVTAASASSSGAKADPKEIKKLMAHKNLQALPKYLRQSVEHILLTGKEPPKASSTPKSSSDVKELEKAYLKDQEKELLKELGQRIRGEGITSTHKRETQQEADIRAGKGAPPQMQSTPNLTLNGTQKRIAERILIGVYDDFFRLFPGKKSSKTRNIRGAHPTGQDSTIQYLNDVMLAFTSKTNNTLGDVRILNRAIDTLEFQLDLAQNQPALSKHEADQLEKAMEHLEGVKGSKEAILTLIAQEEALISSNESKLMTALYYREENQKGQRIWGFFLKKAREELKDTDSEGNAKDRRPSWILHFLEIAFIRATTPVWANQFVQKVWKNGRNWGRVGVVALIPFAIWEVTSQVRYSANLIQDPTYTQQIYQSKVFQKLFFSKSAVELTAEPTRRGAANIKSLSSCIKSLSGRALDEGAEACNRPASFQTHFTSLREILQKRNNAMLTDAPLNVNAAQLAKLQEISEAELNLVRGGTLTEEGMKNLFLQPTTVNVDKKSVEVLPNERLFRAILQGLFTNQLYKLDNAIKSGNQTEQSRVTANLAILLQARGQPLDVSQPIHLRSSSASRDPVQMAASQKIGERYISIEKALATLITTVEGEAFLAGLKNRGTSLTQMSAAFSNAIVAPHFIDEGLGKLPQILTVSGPSIPGTPKLLPRHTAPGKT
jgi:hypothetical protein